ncbi:LOW QUALITY PROTEIN: Gag protein [Phytophthora palmivora]|uniref:Gag protein n=1 Tax=Phytophthora palmivora TaxID=4796 RepID=A0A2P4XAU4_9STRA|nr:LOW QUALITY PROTEIN: Gag protein [Phytophthora palmivora]
MDAALISTDRLRVAFALSNLDGHLGVHKKDDVTELLHNLGSAVQKKLQPAFLPATTSVANIRASMPLNKGKREMHEYIQEMRILAASLVGYPYLNTSK